MWDFKLKVKYQLRELVLFYFISSGNLKLEIFVIFEIANIVF